MKAPSQINVKATENRGTITNRLENAQKEIEMGGNIQINNETIS